jgi:hypothetical protein
MSTLEGRTATRNRERASVISWRKLVLANRYALAMAWNRVFPRHDIWTLRLKSPPSPEEWDESWKSAARSYHEERKHSDKKTPIPPTSCRDFEQKVEWYAQQEAQRRQNDPDLQRLQRLSDESVSLDRAWQELNRPDRFPTPQVTIEAIWECAREQGLDALSKPKNKQRLDSCDGRARAELARRIENLRARTPRTVEAVS